MNIEQRIIAKVNEVVELARVKFPAYTHTAPSVEFYYKGRTAGMAYGYSKVSFNVGLFIQDPERFLNDTVAHEIAHTVCIALGLDRGHGKNWKYVCRVLGGNGKRCFTAEGENCTVVVNKARQVRQYQHRATCGTIIMLSGARHNRTLKGGTYTLRTTRGQLNRNTFTGVIK